MQSCLFGTDVDQDILNSVFEGTKAGGHWGRRIAKTNMADSRYLILS